MGKGFNEIRKYKGYDLTKVKDGGIVWSDAGGWLDCVFDTEETAKRFIDLRKKFTDNFYDVISSVQKKAIEKNNGYVSVAIINEFEILDFKTK